MTPQNAKSKGKELKSYFTIASSGSTLSTCASGNAVVATEEQVLAIEAGNAKDAQVAQQSQPQEETEGIKDFNLDVHIVADPTLCIPIEEFHLDIRDQVRRAYLLKGK